MENQTENQTENQMKITYIGHSGFLVELERTVLLFDYFQGEIPEVSGEKKWYIFASHRHQDHFQPQIFTFARQYPNVQYVFSSDIWRSRVPEELQGQTVSLKAKESWEDGRIQVETLKSTDEGVAFLVLAEGKVIYHAGDLNHWHWDLESEEWNRKMEQNYRKFIEPLRGKTVDAAFIVLDPRQGESYALGMDYALSLIEAKRVYPMHCWEDYSIIERWKKEHSDSPYQECMVTITRRGEHFTQ